jgi:long-chain-fatty-acid--CoA ligase ACSBG
MLSHDNLTWTAKISQLQYKHGWACETIVSFLPLSHVAAQMVDIYGAISIAATVYFARPDALKASHMMRARLTAVSFRANVIKSLTHCCA